MLSTREITRIAVFVALALAFRAVPAPPVPGGFFRFAALPIILSGFILGPRCGLWVGAISDVVEFLLFPTGKPFFPGFTLTQALTGALPSWVMGRAKLSFQRCLLAVATGQIVTKILLVPLFLVFILSPSAKWVVAWQVFVLEAAVTQLFHIPLYAWISYLVMRNLSQRGHSREA